MAEDRAAKRLERMTALSSQKRGNFPIRSSYTSIQELLVEWGDEFKSVAELDSFNYCSIFKDAKTLAVFNRLYRLSPNHKFIFADGADRSCHWKPDSLCVYRDALIGGLRFPIHPFIVKLLADAQVSPCQIAPNAWRAINTFLVIYLKKGFQPSVAVFRKNFSLGIILPVVWAGFLLPKEPVAPISMMGSLSRRTTRSGRVTSCMSIGKGVTGEPSSERVSGVSRTGAPTTSFCPRKTS